MNTVSTPVTSGLGVQSMVTGAEKGKHAHPSIHWLRARSVSKSMGTNRATVNFAIDSISFHAYRVCVPNVSLLWSCARNRCLGEGLVCAMNNRLQCSECIPVCLLIDSGLLAVYTCASSPYK